MQNRLGFIGAGNMAEAIARGVLSSKLYRPSEVIAADVSQERRDLFTDQLKIRTVTSAPSVVTTSEIVLLAVKPQQMADVLASIKGLLTPDQLLISIAAGISTTYLQSALDENARVRIVRAMPNTPMLVGKGMTGICPGRHATPDDLQKAAAIFASAGSVAQVDESHMNAVTALSGSGPAYFFFLVENMIQSGIEMGLTPEIAHQLATQTARGAAEMLCTSPDSPAELRRKVTSPGGTTQAAITHMEQNHMPQTIIAALRAAEKRGQELGK
jgi:pyrroline-5-carboxylate reductase